MPSQQLIQKLKQEGHQIGLHPAFDTWQSTSLLAAAPIVSNISLAALFFTAASTGSDLVGKIPGMPKPRLGLGKTRR